MVQHALIDPQVTELQRIKSTLRSVVAQTHMHGFELLEDLLDLKPDLFDFVWAEKRLQRLAESEAHF